MIWIIKDELTWNIGGDTWVKVGENAEESLPCLLIGLLLDQP